MLRKEIGHGHQHICASCGERWGCMDRCLDKCGCIGRPYCMHFYCSKCRDHALVEHYSMVRLPEEVDHAQG
jgi:hypothetical protein